MIITTKFNFNERVYFLDAVTGKVQDGVIQNIDIRVYSDVPMINYRLRSSIGPLIPEDKCFETKLSLVESL